MADSSSKLTPWFFKMKGSKCKNLKQKKYSWKEVYKKRKAFSIHFSKLSKKKTRKKHSFENIWEKFI